MSRRAPRLGLLAAALLLTGCATPPERTPALPAGLVRLTTHEFEILMPDTLPAGLVRVRVVNDGAYWHHALFTQLDSTQTADGYVAELRKGVDFPGGAIDRGGTPLIAPGDSSETILRLSPGRWVALCTASGGGTWHAAAGMARGFAVVERPGRAAVTEPADALPLILRDDGFEFPDTLVAGPRWVRVENHGVRWHECDILRLEPGRTAADYRAWRARERPDLPRVATPVGGVADYVAGETVWSLADFRPGRHLLVCDMPGDSLHHRTFEVIAAR